MRKSDLGVSTASLYPLYTEEALQILLEQGFRVFEVFFNAQEEISPQFLARLKATAEPYGAIFTALHPYTSLMESMLLFGGYERRTEEGFTLYQSYLEAAAYLGAKYVVLHGQWEGGRILNPHETASDHRQYFEMFGRLYRAGRDIGAFPIQENVKGNRSAKPEFIRAMREELREDCAFVMDLKQCRISDVEADEMLSAMGDRLKHLHLSDAKGEYSCLLPGFGDDNFGAFFRRLDEVGYQGRAVIEVYKSSYQHPSEIAESRKRMLALLPN